MQEVWSSLNRWIVDRTRRTGAPHRNFTLTVRRLRQVLIGHDAWLLSANSKGIDVWCAASGGHLTQHDGDEAESAPGEARLVLWLGP